MDDKWHDLNESLLLTEDQLEPRHNDGLTKFVRVECTEKGSERIVYHDVKIFMPKLDKFMNDYYFDGSDPETPSVLVLAIESMTRINFFRSMPKTAGALREIGPVFYMKGLTRIADNTFPNMLAFTTGQLQGDLDEEYELAELPFIWKLFERLGYVTAFIDDNPNYSRSMLSYATEGFPTPPTTFYPQPFWSYWNKMEPDNGDEENCLDGKTREVPQMYLDQVERFLRHVDAHQLPHFTMSMLIRTTHYGFKNAEKLDKYYEPFIRRIAPLLNNTILIVMGDHGDRFSEEMTLLEKGRIESRLPLMAIRLPPTLLELYPEWGDTMLQNKKRLTTNLDVHKALVQLAQLVANNTGANITDQQQYTDHAYSVMHELAPLNRVCSDARIPDLYCVCRMKRVTEANMTLVKSVVVQFMEQLNSILPSDKCQRLTLARIDSAVMYANAKPSLLDVMRNKEVLEFSVVVAPSGAMLRTKMSRVGTSNWSPITADHEIERLNLYGNQSHCIENRVLRKYCICHDIVGELQNGAQSTTQSSDLPSTVIPTSPACVTLGRTTMVSKTSSTKPPMAHISQNALKSSPFVSVTAANSTS